MIKRIRSIAGSALPKQHRQQGFTLVEVMVALMIVAVAVSALLVQMMSSVDHIAYLRDKTIAHWVALNQLELAYMENEYNNTMIDKARTGSEEMAGREWFWTIKPVKTANQDFLQLQVSVALDQETDSSLVQVIGMIDPFHKRQ